LTTQTCQQLFLKCDSWPDVPGQTGRADVSTIEDSESVQTTNQSKLNFNSH